MTNKLPVVGKRYILKFLKRKGSSLELLRMDDTFVEMKYPGNQIEKYSFPKEDFWKMFEELPEDKAETKPETQSLELSPEVKEAMEELNYKLNNHICDYEVLSYKSRKLLNALEKQFANNKIQAEEVVDNKIEEKSIWKPVGELPQKEAKLWVKRKDGEIVPSRYNASEILQFSGNCLEDIHSWCYLTDFINEQEKLKERVKKLEGVK